MARIILVLICLVLSDPAAISSPPPIEITGDVARAPRSTTPGPVNTLTPYETELVAWAQERFESVGLHVPTTSIAFETDRRACDMAGGLYRGRNGAHSVTVCVRASESFAADLQRRRTLLHELAHAWEQEHLDDADRQRLNERFGTASWSDGTHAWSERGAEHFAETMVFGLLDQTKREVKIDVGCPELAARFSAITGKDVPGPHVPWCLA